MRTLSLLFVTAILVTGQSPSVTGTLLERDTIPGEFSIRAPDNQVLRFFYDTNTVVQADGLAAPFSRVTLGDRVQVDSEPVEGSLLRRAKSVLVTTPQGVRMVTTLRVPHKQPAAPERTFSSTSLTYAGVVTHFTPQHLVLHTRTGDETLLIRQDTRYVADGAIVEAAALRPNMRVFVRAGKDLYQQLEAYQVIWGSIFVPGRRPE